MRYQFSGKDMFYTTFMMVAAFFMIIQRDVTGTLLINDFKGLGLAVILLLAAPIIRVIIAMNELAGRATADMDAASYRRRHG